MKENELRIGNWVLSPTEGEVQIENGWQIDEGEEVEPIPLTEEWLFKFGFENKGHGFSDNIYYKQSELLNWGYRVVMSKTGMVLQHGFMNKWSELTSLKHVHSLQNLIFALTGEELTQ